MTLTDEGRRFYEEVGPHLDGIEQAAIIASGAAGIVRGRLRVNVDPFFSRVVLAAQISKFLDRHPEVRLELIMRDHVGDLVAASTWHCASAIRRAVPLSRANWLKPAF
jgi:DNA-binding transcriptional LysR family regulator